MEMDSMEPLSNIAPSSRRNWRVFAVIAQRHASVGPWNAPLQPSIGSDLDPPSRDGKVGITAHNSQRRHLRNSESASLFQKRGLANQPRGSRRSTCRSATRHAVTGGVRETEPE
jgi:hypothetical protein